MGLYECASEFYARSTKSLRLAVFCTRITTNALGAGLTVLFRTYRDLRPSRLRSRSLSRTLNRVSARFSVFRAGMCVAYRCMWMSVRSTFSGLRALTISAGFSMLWIIVASIAALLGWLSLPLFLLHETLYKPLLWLRGSLMRSASGRPRKTSMSTAPAERAILPLAQPRDYFPDSGDTGV